MYYGYYDPTYVLVVFAFLLSMIASFGVKTTFSRYDKVHSMRGMTGYDAASRILSVCGLSNVKIERVRGNLTDCYDPRTNTLRLSDATYASTSVAAIGVAAHECGHAVQHKEGYAPIRLRNKIVPVVNIGNSLSMPLFLIGLILGFYELAIVGAGLFGLVLLFQLVTLPVEINASRRAIKIIREYDFLESEEAKGAKKVLFAAAMTYVAAVAATALQFLRLIILANNRRRD